MKTSLFKYLSPVFAIFFAYNAYADNLKFNGDYIFSWSGIRIGKLNLAIDQDNSDYKVQSSLKTSGIVAMFSDHKSTTNVNGTIKNSSFQPINYQSNYYSGGKDKLIALKFDINGNIINEEISPPKRASRPEVPKDLKDNIGDSLTAILTMREEIKTALKDNITNIKVPVFDGKRRFDLHANIINSDTTIHLNEEKINAVKLGLKREAIAGFKDKELKKMAKGEPLLEFFIDKNNFTLLGFQMPLYGGTVMAWVRDACINKTCQSNQTASK